MYMRQLSRLFLNSVSADILETIKWYVNERVSVPVICKNAHSNCSKSTSISLDKPPLLQTLYPILDSLDINTGCYIFKELVI